MAAHQNLLWASCRPGELQMARELLLAGADPNTKAGCNNWTCLMEAIWGSQEEVVDLLLAQPGLDVNAKNNNNSTALHYACEFDLYSMDYACVIRNRNRNIAILSKLLAVPEILVNERDSKGWTPIMVAIIFGKPEAVRVMAAVENVDLEVRSSNGWSLEDLAHRRAKYDKC